MSVFISVVSHGHGEIIKKLSCLVTLSKHFTVVVKLNKSEPDLVCYLDNHNILYINEFYGLGFGHNNNLVYNFCKERLSMTASDYFLVVNPDIFVDVDVVGNLIMLMSMVECKLAGVNLFKSKDFLISDNSIRKFPNFFQFTMSFLKIGNSTLIDKKLITAPTKVDWAAGSFLAFKVSHYETLRGFDESYFMYCEDIDICYRSHLIGERVTYFPEIKALHLAKHANRKILSKHFYWHLASVLRFLLTKFGLTKSKSSLYR